MHKKMLIQYDEPTRDEIAACAYSIWENEGRPAGREIAHWLQAEAHLVATRKHDAGLVRESVPEKPLPVSLHPVAA